MKLENSYFNRSWLHNSVSAQMVLPLVLCSLFTCVTSVSAQQCSSEGPASAKSTTDDKRATLRLDSARVLTDEATQLSRMKNVLTRWSWCLAVLEKETPHAAVEEGSVSETRATPGAEKAPSRKFDVQNFQKLLTAYQESRRQYLEHKLLYDQHVTQFHNQPHSVQTIQPSGGNEQLCFAAPKFQSLKLKVEDACSQLQLAERVLFQTESELAAMVNYISANKSKAGSDSYFQSWSSAQALGASLQREVVEYGNVVLRKQSNTEDQMHTMEQSAITNGDFVQSRNIYGEVQRCSALNNEETKSAHLHTMFTAEILTAISSLSPLVSSAAAPSSSGSYISADELQRESQTLQAEYETMQQQYSDAEKANPADQAARQKR